MRIFVVSLLCILGFSAVAEGPGESPFAEGVRLYRLEQYRAASVSFERCVRATPDASECHHWLGKAYGRLAERSNPLVAFRLAGKTRRALERAVALDESNAAAVESLAQYYERAPAFLGGNRREAERLRAHLGGPGIGGSTTQ